MIQNIKKYVDLFTSLNQPIPYNSLNIHQIYMKDYYEFHSCIDILRIQKNKIPEIRIIQMSYMQFLVYECLNNSDEKQKEIYMYKFYTLFSKIFQCEIKDILFVEDNDGKLLLKINDNLINSQEFEEIRKIILYSNLSDYDEEDEDMSDDFRRAIEEFYSLKNKGVTPPELNDKIIFIMAETGIIRKDIINMTLLEFDNLFNQCNSDMEYKINRTAELSGNVKFDKPVEHPIYKKKRHKYAEVFSNADDFVKEIQSV